MVELGERWPDLEGGIRDGTPAAWPVGSEAGRGVPLPQRGLVALGRARADARAVAAAQRCFLCKSARNLSK